MNSVHFNVNFINYMIDYHNRNYIIPVSFESLVEILNRHKYVDLGGVHIDDYFCQDYWQEFSDLNQISISGRIERSINEACRKALLRNNKTYQKLCFSCRSSVEHNFCIGCRKNQLIF
jgi:hypothetical protein